jgi:hypothetical protein
VGPKGEVLATDIAENLVRYLEQDAAAAGLTQVQAAVIDGKDLRVRPGRVRRGDLLSGRRYRGTGSS